MTVSLLKTINNVGFAARHELAEFCDTCCDASGQFCSQGIIVDLVVGVVAIVIENGEVSFSDLALVVALWLDQDFACHLVGARRYVARKSCVGSCSEGNLALVESVVK